MVNVRIITPSYLMKSRQDHAAGLAQLSAHGFHVLNPEFPRKLPGAREKAAQLHAAFADPAVQLVLAQRGGYSAMKLLPFLDFELISSHPKLLAGFSDLSALLTPIFERTGLVTLHGPMLTSLKAPSALTLDSFLNAVHGFREKDLLRGAPVQVLCAGKAQGTLKGGNLITLTALIGTPWEIDTRGAILFFEEVDEKLYKIDRCLTQWLLAGKFDGVRGLVLGDFSGVKAREVCRILSSQIELGFPVLHCPRIGHVPDQLTLPVGAEVELNTHKKLLNVSNLTFPLPSPPPLGEGAPKSPGAHP